MNNVAINQDFIDYLKSCDICRICQLRFLNLPWESQKLKSEIDHLSVEENAVKKHRVNACITCLGLFSDELLSEILEQIDNSNIKKFECEGFGIALSLPTALKIRQISMWYALINKFGDKVSRTHCPDIPIKEMARAIISPLLCRKFAKTYDTNGIVINIILDYSDDKTETLEFLKSTKFLTPNEVDCKNITQKYIEKNFSPANLPATIGKIPLISLSIPTSRLILKNITVLGPTVFVVGRYNKFSRKLSHTPWFLERKRVMEDSIEEILVRNVAPVFCDSDRKIIFSSSGREDVDVRCLGNGRPFALEISNSLRVTLPKAIARVIEINIGKSKKISVKNLQIAQREDLSQLKNAEENKLKYYTALCTFKNAVTKAKIQKLNIEGQFEILQKTPLRVLHRRPLHTRPRKIYSLKTLVVKDNPRVVVMSIATQAGTYIKELIHGDFGRTTPSISSIVGECVDIIALDVVGIDIDWPKAVD